MGYLRLSRGRPGFDSPPGRLFFLIFGKKKMKFVLASAFRYPSSNCRDSIVVSTLRCGRNNPGSNPGHGTFFLGNRGSLSKWQELCCICSFLFFKPKDWARPGFEPGTSRTQSENHTPSPTSHECNKFVAVLKSELGW